MASSTGIRRPSSDTTTSTNTDRSDSTAHARRESGESASMASPSITSAWTAADDEMLASARAAGMNWQPIASRYFPRKSANACRKRHERLMDRRDQDDWEQGRLEELASAYFDVRKEMWAILGERLGERWALVENKCMEKGLKNLHTIARASSRKRARLDGSPGMTPELDHDTDTLSDDELEIVHNRPTSDPPVRAVAGTSSSSLGKRSRSPSSDSEASSPAGIQRVQPHTPQQPSLLPAPSSLPAYRPASMTLPLPTAVRVATSPPVPISHMPRSVTSSPMVPATLPSITRSAGTTPPPRVSSEYRRDVLSIQSILSPAD